MYECRVMHHRLTPKDHHFNHRVFYLWLDLDELDALAAGLTLFSKNRFNVFSFFDGDHLDMGKGNVRDNLLEWIRQQGTPIENITCVKLLAFPRVLDMASIRYPSSTASMPAAHDLAGWVDPRVWRRE
jgi:hypothetical protein